MALDLLHRHRQEGMDLAAILRKTLQQVHQCAQCRNYAQLSLCEVCLDQTRDQTRICVVVQPSDLLAIDQSGMYKGLYFVLTGLLSPIENITPENIGLGQLEQMVDELNAQEVILALSATLEGEATAHYIQTMLQQHCVVSRIAQGIPQGSELEYLDTSTLALAMKDRR